MNMIPASFRGALIASITLSRFAYDDLKAGFFESLAANPIAFCADNKAGAIFMMLSDVFILAFPRLIDD
tara:strand:- start:198 stop:404 length:207 start_codon:yes stop_codon:yes gene_type:complete